LNGVPGIWHKQCLEGQNHWEQTLTPRWSGFFEPRGSKNPQKDR
jgi:hypothetical protein